MICTRIATLASLLEDYLQTHPIKPASAQQLKISCDALAAWYERTRNFPLRLDDLSEALASEWLNDLHASQRAAKTINRRRGDLLALWRHAHRRGLATAPEAREIVRFAEPRRRPTAWHLPELQQLLAACARYRRGRPVPGWDARHDRALVLVMYDTAFRFSACLELRRGDLSLDGTIQARAESQKHNADECRWLAAETQTALAAILKDLPPGPAGEPDPAARLFPWPYRKEAFWRRWKAILRLAGLPATRRDGPQKLRRTSATYLEALRPGTAQQHLGHATAGLASRHYIDPTIAYDFKAAELLPRLSAEARKETNANTP